MGKPRCIISQTTLKGEWTRGGLRRLTDNVGQVCSAVRCFDPHGQNRGCDGRPCESSEKARLGRGGRAGRHVDRPADGRSRTVHGRGDFQAMVNRLNDQRPRERRQSAGLEGGMAQAPQRPHGSLEENMTCHTLRCTPQYPMYKYYNLIVQCTALPWTRVVVGDPDMPRQQASL